MPYLRYSRNKKGDENTYVLHGSRAGGRPEILYMFRTPPNIKVGRGSLEPEVLSAIELAHPELTFDWDKMRRDRPKPIVPSAGKFRRDQKLKTVGRDRNFKARSERAFESRTDGVDIRSEQAGLAERITRSTELPVGEEPNQGSERDKLAVGVTDQVPRRTDGDVEPIEHTQQKHVVSELLGAAVLNDLRSRYLQLLERFDSAELEGSARSALSERVNALDPDGWDAGEEVVHAIESFDREWQQTLELIEA